MQRGRSIAIAAVYIGTGGKQLSHGQGVGILRRLDQCEFVRG